MGLSRKQVCPARAPWVRIPTLSADPDHRRGSRVFTLTVKHLRALLLVFTLALTACSSALAGGNRLAAQDAVPTIAPLILVQASTPLPRAEPAAQQTPRAHAHGALVAGAAGARRQSTGHGTANFATGGLPVLPRQRHTAAAPQVRQRRERYPSHPARLQPGRARRAARSDLDAARGHAGGGPRRPDPLPGGHGAPGPRWTISFLWP